MFAVALIGIIVVKVSMALNAATRVYDIENVETDLDDQARRVLDRIALAILGSDRDALIPDQESPLHSSSLQYELNLGVNAGQVVWGDPELISNGTGTQVLWQQDPGGAAQRRVVWSNIVRPFLEGELPDGVDNNGNGLIDESGLSFVVDRDKVTIRMTLERPVEGGFITKTVTTEATCRN